MKTAIPDSINIKNHLSDPAKLHCFPLGLDYPKLQAHGPEDSPTTSLCLPTPGAATMPSVTLMPECHSAICSQKHLPRQSLTTASQPTLSFILIFFLNTDESQIVYFSMSRSNMTFQTFNPCRKSDFAVLTAKAIGTAK